MQKLPKIIIVWSLIPLYIKQLRSHILELQILVISNQYFKIWKKFNLFLITLIYFFFLIGKSISQTLLSHILKETSQHNFATGKMLKIHKTPIKLIKIFSV